MAKKRKRRAKERRQLPKRKNKVWNGFLRE